MSKNINRYSLHLSETIKWIAKSIHKEQGGSSAYFGIWGKWANPYPETTGYIIPTLINYANQADQDKYKTVANNLGRWLLEIQCEDGYWLSGKHPPKKSAEPSVFNTGQIILGLVALYEETKDTALLKSAELAANWLVESLDRSSYTWNSGNYKPGFNPSYYTRVTWPILEVFQITGDIKLKEISVEVLNMIASRKRVNGSIEGWGFSPGAPAFLHTIVYTIRGFQECERILGENIYYDIYLDALNRLIRKAELKSGYVPGAFAGNWEENNNFICLTGNAQLSLCIINQYDFEDDLRLINAACKLVDLVCDSQSLNSPIPGVKGAVAGSKPIWGKYMCFRYPNWAAKFHCDALMKLIGVLKKLVL